MLLNKKESKQTNDIKQHIVQNTVYFWSHKSGEIRYTFDPIFTYTRVQKKMVFFVQNGNLIRMNDNIAN